jgi:hypothetical protein
MMIGYDIYDCFTMEHFRLRQRMTLTIKIYCSRLYIIFMKTARGGSKKNNEDDIFCNVGYSKSCWVNEIVQ